MCAEDALIYVEDYSVAGLPFEDVVNVVRAARPPRTLVFERARTITLVVEERVNLSFKLDPKNETHKVIASLPRQVRILFTCIYFRVCEGFAILHDR